MKKIFLTLTVFAFAGISTYAQSKKLTPTTKKETASISISDNATTDIKATPANAEQNTTIKFNNETHEFGNLKEGDAAEAEFVFTNTGKEPLIIKNVQPQCGCTTPYYSKDAVAPGETGVIKAAYGTKGRPGSFNKKVTVVSNAGTNTLWIKGNVEKAPETSVPQNTSMIKTQ